MRIILPLSTLCLFAAPALAGEGVHLGTVTMTGSSVTNVSTAVPFVIPAGSKLTVYCSAAVQMLTDSATVSTGTLGTKGVFVPAITNFPTSVDIAKATTLRGTIGGSTTAVIAFIGTAAVTCDVWSRLGTE